MTATKTKGTYWRMIWAADRHAVPGGALNNVGLNPDGTLHNPNGYPEELVRASIAGALERRHARMSAAAKKAAKTRAERKERNVYRVVAKLKAGGKLTPGTHCEICGKGLGDPESKARGIGSDCWQFILDLIDGSQQQRAAAGTA